MKLEARLTHETVRFDQNTDAHLVLSLSAPVVNTDQVRPKLAIILCIDISGSMAGQKLEYAKQSAYKVIEHLKNDDYLGIVAFGSNVRVLARPASVGGNKDTLRKAVAALQTEGMTNFAGGMIQSIELLKGLDLGGNYIHRVIMLTDGAANVGPAKSKADILKLLTANRDHITCSAFGYGATGVSGGEFDPDLLSEFAKTGEGNYAHVENPDNALKAFGTELGGLISTYATDLKIELKGLNGHSIERVVSDVDVDEEASGEVIVNIPDLLAEETRHIVVAVKLAAQKTHGPRAVNVFSVSATYQTFDAQGKRESHEIAVKGRVQFVNKDDLKKGPAELENIVGLAQLVRAQLEAEEKARKGDYSAAAAVMNSFSDNMTSRGLDRLAAASHNLASKLGTADSYTSNSGYLRSFNAGMSRGMGVACYAGGSDADLADLGVQMANTTTTATSNAFAGGVALDPVAAPLPDLSGMFTFDPSSAILNQPQGSLGGGGWGGIGGSSAGADWSVHPTPGMHMVAPQPGISGIMGSGAAVMGYVPSTVTTVIPSIPQAPVMVSPDQLDALKAALAPTPPSPTHETKKGSRKGAAMKSVKQSRKSW